MEVKNEALPASGSLNSEKIAGFDESDMEPEVRMALRALGPEFEKHMFKSGRRDNASESKDAGFSEDSTLRNSSSDDTLGEDDLAESSFFRQGPFIHYASRRFLDSTPERFLLLGTANFLSALGRTLDLQADVIVLALRIFFAGGEAPCIRRNRKAAAAAALLLAWKHIEDSDASRSQRRLHAIFRAFFRLTVREEAHCFGNVASEITKTSFAETDGDGGVEKPSTQAASAEEKDLAGSGVSEILSSSSQWFARDCGSGSRHLGALLRACELELLQFVQFNLGSPRSAFSQLRRHCRLFLAECSGEEWPLKNKKAQKETSATMGCQCCRGWASSRGRDSASLLEALTQRSSEELLLLHLSPLALEFASSELAAAAPVAAAIALNLPLLGLLRKGKGSGQGPDNASSASLASEVVSYLSDFESHVRSYLKEAAWFSVARSARQPEESVLFPEERQLTPRVLRQVLRLSQMTRVWLCALENSKPLFKVDAKSLETNNKGGNSSSTAAKEKVKNDDLEAGDSARSVGCKERTAPRV